MMRCAFSSSLSALRVCMARARVILSGRSRVRVLQKGGGGTEQSKSHVDVFNKANETDVTQRKKKKMINI